MCLRLGTVELAVENKVEVVRKPASGWQDRVGPGQPITFRLIGSARFLCEPRFDTRLQDWLGNIA